MARQCLAWYAHRPTPSKSPGPNLEKEPLGTEPLPPSNIKVPPKNWITFKANWTCPICVDNPQSISTTILQTLPFYEEPLPGEGDDVVSYTNYNYDTNQIINVPIPNFVDGLKFGQLNCNRLWGKRDEIRHFLETAGFTILCINESKLDDSTPSSFINVPGYSLLRFDRQGRDGGGSLIYIKDGFRFLPLNYDVTFPNEVEVNCVQLFPPFHKPIIVVLIYRPPVDSLKPQFIRSFESLLFQIERDNVESIILGDFNIDLNISDKITSSLSSLTSSFGYKQPITESTRVTLTTSTLIDHIFTSFPSRIKQSDVSWEAVGSYISKVNWDGVNPGKSSDENLESFENVVTFALDQFCPEKKKQIKGNSPNWMSNEILSLINERNSLKKDYESNPSAELLLKYRKFRNFVGCRVSKAKKIFIFKIFPKLTIQLQSGKLTTSYLALANCFVVPDLTPPEVRESLMQSVKEQAMDEGVSDNCNVTEFEVANSSSRMKWKSSPTDFIPAKAVVVPLYKGKGSVTDPGNYRPISMLPNLSKLFEYVINTRLMLDVERKGDYVSTTFFDNRGIGQGTVNGPALFILFFNKVASVLNDCSFIAFADDLVVYFEASNLETACEQLTPGEATKARKECYKAFKSIDFSLLLEKHNLLTCDEVSQRQNAPFPLYPPSSRRRCDRLSPKPTFFGGRVGLTSQLTPASSPTLGPHNFGATSIGQSLPSARNFPISTSRPQIEVVPHTFGATSLGQSLQPATPFPISTSPPQNEYLASGYFLSSAKRQPSTSSTSHHRSLRNPLHNDSVPINPSILIGTTTSFTPPPSSG
ncbi:putative RNA-directed DNA polymerase from transposon X-element [Folsomia candida]|uniref:Putative RNA-directed DNA polymerase from transposon X-element n=1 Tax=Folsomia candida TaxID=158441 RepID=A0A226DF99_FOLCA|nr:putative RNA-directed DNA polymerase from transposon X-element [Folsomia candida]